MCSISVGSPVTLIFVNEVGFSFVGSACVMAVFLPAILTVAPIYVRVGGPRELVRRRPLKHSLRLFVGIIRSS